MKAREHKKQQTLRDDFSLVGFYCSEKSSVVVAVVVVVVVVVVVSIKSKAE
jgi:hypothetical protein